MKLLDQHRFMSLMILAVLLTGLTLSGPVLGAGLSAVQTAEAASVLSPLHVEGRNLVNANGQIVRLKGVNTPSLEWSKSGENINQAHYEYLSNTWMANVVRVPINQDWAMTDDAYLAKLDSVVSWTKNAGLYLIFDLHWISGKQQPLPNANSQIMWGKLASRWSGESHILYDIYNEPFDCDWNTWKPWAEKLIDAVRVGDPDAVCVVGGPDWSYDLRGMASSPINRPNIVLSTHDYPWKGLDRQQAYGFLADRYPILVGEWGGDDTKAAWAAALKDYINGKGLSYTAWAMYPGGGGFPSLVASWSYDTTVVGRIVKDDLAQGAGISPAPSPTPSPIPDRTPGPPPTVGPVMPSPTPVSEAKPVIRASDVLLDGNTVTVRTVIRGNGELAYIKWHFYDTTTWEEIASVTSPATVLDGRVVASGLVNLPSGRYEIGIGVFSDTWQGLAWKGLSGKRFALPSSGVVPFTPQPARVLTAAQ